MSLDSKRNRDLMGTHSTARGLRRTACFLGIGLTMLMVMVGCHSTPSATTTPAAVAITMGSAPSSVTVGQTYQFSATVSNAANTAVTWSAGGVAGGNSTVGTISSSGLYTAPAMMPSPASVSITATSQADSTKSVSASVSINISLTLNMTSASLQVTATQQFTPTILGTSDTDITWTVNGVAGGNATVGTISSAGLYSAPPYPTSPNTVTVTATSVAESSMSASCTVTLAAPPITVSVNPTALDLQVGHSVQFSDVVTTSTALPISTAVTWGVGSPGATGNGVAGTITSTGDYTAPTRVPISNPIKVYVVSQEDSSKSATALVTVTSAPVLLQISTTILVNGVADTPYSATISAFGGAQPYAWSITGSLPTGLTLNSSTGVISGTPTTAGASSFTVNVTDQTSPTAETATASLSITIIPPLSIATTALPRGSVGASYTASLAETGGVSPYTWSITSGSLPSGLTLNPATGAITGTPATGTGSTTGQPYLLTLKVTDSGTPQQTKTFSPSLTIYNGVIITTASPVNTAFVEQPYTYTVQAVGGLAPYTWLYTSLPSWLSVTPSTGLTSAISGTPTAPATAATFTVQVTDANGVHNSVNLNIAVSTLLTFPAVNLPNGVVSTAYSTSLLAAGGGTTPFTYSLVSGAGSLPAGLTLNPSSGAISGTPATAGTSNFSVKVADSSIPPQTHTQALSVTIYTVLTITTASLPNGTVNSSYRASLSSGGGTGTINWALASGSSLPAGLQLSASGTVSGTPTTAATTSFTVTATDSGTPQQAKNRSLNIVVNPVLSIVTSTLPNGTVGAAYNQNIQTNGGTPTITWSVPANTLPTGLQLQNAANGIGTITGNPTASGSYTFTVTASDASTPVQSVSQQYTIVINNAPLAINTTQLPDVAVNTAYEEPLQASGGTPPYTWTVASGSTLPSWLSITGSGTNWKISGTPTSANTYNFTLQVTDSSSTPQTKTQALSVDVTSAAAACTDAGSESILQGQYAFSLSGYNSAGFLAAVGSLTANGAGKFTGGTVDSNGTLVQSAATIDTTRSSYSVGSNHLGCATIVTTSGTFTTRLSLGGITSNVATAGRLVEWDNPGSSTYYAATGQILKQTIPSNLPSGTYAYHYAGVYGISQQRAGVVGIITANAGASGGTYTSGEYDINVNGVINDGNGTSAPFAGITGTYTNPDSTTGRYTTATTLNSLTARHVAYLVSGSQFLELQTDALSSTTSVLVGQGQLQTGTFGNSSVNGKVVVYMTGLNGGGTGGSASFALVALSPTTQSLTGTNYYNGGGTWQTPTPGTMACSYAVATNGRMTLTGCGSGAPVFYLTAANTAFTMSMDTDVAVGQVVQQVVPTGGFSSSTVSGTYYSGDGEVANYGAASNGRLGVMVLTMSNGSGTLIQDFTSLSDGQQADDTQSTGTLTVNSDGSFSTNSNGDINAVMISTTEFLIIDNSDGTYPTIQVGKQ